MQEDDRLKKRTSFIITLLQELKQVYSQLINISSDIEKSSGSFYMKTFEESKDYIQIEMDKYKLNIERIKQLNCDITLKTNTWYNLVKNSEEIKKVVFPFIFYFSKKKLKRDTKSINEEILGLTVQNRLIIEQLTIWEHELELKVIQQIKQAPEYKNYEELAGKKEELISQLKYLLPTLPDICPVVFNLADIDSIVEKLSKMAAA